MKKLLLILLFVTGVFGNAAATTYTFNPSPADLWDLEHGYAYTWGINWSTPADQYITGVTLSFDNIRNNDDSSNDLWVHLLYGAAEGTAKYWDDDGTISDYYEGQGTLLYHWEDLPSTGQDLELAISAIGIVNFLHDGNFGFGFDPDCHYFNDGITLTIETLPIPEPQTLLLLGMGLLSFAGISRKQMKA